MNLKTFAKILTFIAGLMILALGGGCGVMLLTDGFAGSSDTVVGLVMTITSMLLSLSCIYLALTSSVNSTKQD